MANGHGGKRPNAGRKNNPIPTRRMMVCEDIYLIIKKISDAYKEAPESKRELIKEYLEEIAQ